MKAIKLNEEIQFPNWLNGKNTPLDFIIKWNVQIIKIIIGLYNFKFITGYY